MASLRAQDCLRGIWQFLQLASFSPFMKAETAKGLSHRIFIQNACFFLSTK